MTGPLPVHSPDMDAGATFTRLVESMASLREPDGCPWDRDQTHESIKPYLIEETYEVVEAIERQDDSEFCTELGDVLAPNCPPRPNGE